MYSECRKKRRMSDGQTIELEEGWSSMDTSLAKLERILEGSPERFTSGEYMHQYTMIYNMCNQKPPYDYSKQLYERFKGVYVEYINSSVIPSLREKSDEFLLKELIRRWKNHKRMTRYLKFVFHYLDRYYIPRSSFPDLTKVGLCCFHDLVYLEFQSKANDVVKTQINQERDEYLIDKALLKEVVDMYLELGMNYYVNDFENDMLNDATAYYSRKASQWIVEYSCPDYMIKVEECLENEKARVSHYMHSSTKAKLLEKVLEQLLTPHNIKELLQREDSGCRALLRNEKVEDLSRMNKLFQKVWGGLEQLIDTFKQYVIDEGMVLIKQANDAMITNKKLLTKIIELHDKSLAYVNGCFSRSSKFNKALKEASESFCSKVVGRFTTAERLSLYCHNILEKGLTGKISFEATKGVLDRAVRLLAYISDKDQQLADFFKQYVKDEGMILIEQADDAMSNKDERAGKALAAELVTKIIELHNRFLAYVTDCFSRASKFDKAMKEAFQSFCNKVVGGCTTAEILASYCDDILRKAAAGNLSSEAAEGSLERAACVLAYIYDKDIFAEFYRKKLVRRLLFDRIALYDQETFALSKLKQLYGRQFTSKLEGMVTDMEMAKGNQNEFQQYLRDEGTNLGLDLAVTVITAAYWPSYKSCDLKLPAEMANCVRVFNEYYQGKPYCKRKLTWISSLGNCIIKGNFQKKPIELILATYQAAMLLLFNDAERLSYSDIKRQLNLGDDDNLIRVLHSLSCSKYKILNKEPNTNFISHNDSFEFNSNFTHKMRKIKVPLAPPEERKTVIESVEKDRHHVIDATLVRIMKSSKVLAYQQLITDCVERLSKFKPEVKDIKMRIEDLITREYLERDRDCLHTLKYLP